MKFLKPTAAFVMLSALSAMGSGAAFAESDPRVQWNANRNVVSSSAAPNALKIAQNTSVAGLEWETNFDQPDETPYVSADTSSDPMLSADSVGKLHQAIQRYSELARDGGWPEVPGGPNLQIGSRDNRVILLRKRLEAEGDLKETSEYLYHFDTSVERAVRSFQVRYGLPANGAVDQITLEKMNVPAYVRFSTMQSNLERLHGLVKSLKGRYVVVNIPAAQIEAVENGRVFSRHLAVVGKIDRPTPVLNSNISQINFNPYWHVPKSIARRDLLPLIRKDISYLAENHIRVFQDWAGEEVDASGIDWETATEEDYVFRQDPGYNNAMASVKINFSNKHAVFLHDTPTKSLFGQYIRTFSSGCVRVERVHDLVDWLISDQDGVDRRKINQITFNVERTDVDLKKPVPLKMVYMTAWAKSDGMVHFRDDIYQLDQAEVAAVSAETAPESAQ